MKARIMGRVVEIRDNKVIGGSGCVTPYRVSGSRREPAIHKTTSQHSELAQPPILPGWPNPTDKRNKWNYAYAQFLEIEKSAGNIRYWWYESQSFWLVRPDKERKEQGLRHKVDFMIWENDGSITMVEVKGYSRNLRDGITRYKIAREQYPCYKWRLVRLEKNGWVDY